MLFRDRDRETPEVRANAIRGLMDQAKPSSNRIIGLMDGLDAIVDRAKIAWKGQYTG